MTSETRTPHHHLGTCNECARWCDDMAASLNKAQRQNTDLLAALEAAVERMEAVAAGIPVHNRAKGVSQATHVAHMAAHLGQHAKIAQAAIRAARGDA